MRTLRAQVLGAGFPPLSDDDVRGVAAPTLLMTGERSPAYLPRLTDRLQQLLPNAERVEIAGASHVMSEENPGAVNEAILGFLARHAGQKLGEMMIGWANPRRRSRHRRPRGCPNARPCRLLGRGRRAGAHVGRGGDGYLPAGNAARALRALGLEQAVLERGVVIPRQRVSDDRGRLLVEVDLAELWDGVGPCLALHRADLHAVLLDGARDVPIRMGVDVRGLRERDRDVRWSSATEPPANTTS